ncbi:MAG: flagellar hook protein FlgE [Burkholderiales bacterium]
MGFGQGLSGLNTASKNLDVIGNNVSNATSVGFKTSQAQFSDVYAASLTGGSSGLGTQLSAVVTQFSQGNVSTSNNPLDLAINGKGFFRMSTNGAVSYTRNGQFQLDKQGFIVDSSGRNLTGFGVTTIPDPTNLTRTVDVPNTGVPQVLQISPNAQSSARATGGSGAGKGVNWQFNLDSRLATPTTALVSTLASPVPSTASYNSATSVQIYDTLGNPHSMTTYYVKNSVASAALAPPGGSVWDMYLAVDGTQMGNIKVNGTAQAPASVLQLQFDTSGALKQYLTGGTGTVGGVGGAAGTALPLSTPPTITVDMTAVLAQQTPAQTNLASATQNFTLDMSNSTQFGANFAVSVANQDGYTSGGLAGYNISPNGAVLARYTNGQSQTLGFVRLDGFPNPQGLIPTGSNQWVESSASGQPVAGTPGVGAFGVVQSGAVEDSNVDLTKELVDMITAQRNYQANAQAIKTQDQVLNTLVNLR